MTTLLAIGDVHGELARLDRTLALFDDADAPDLVLLPGDLTADPARGNEATVTAVLDRLVARYPGVPVAYVPGNHDLPEPPAHPTATNVDGAPTALAGLTVAGLGGAGPQFFGFPYEWSEDDAGARIRQFEALLDGRPLDLWLCHTPPHNTRLDFTKHGQHVGSRAVREALARLRPRLFVCGHIHESLGVQALDGVPCLNAGALGRPYGRIVAYRIDWDAGPARIERRELLGAERRIETAWPSA